MSGLGATGVSPCDLLRICQADMSEPREFPPRRSAQNPIDVIPVWIRLFGIKLHDKERHALGVFRHILDATRHHIGLKLGEHSLDLNMHGTFV